MGTYGRQWDIMGCKTLNKLIGTKTQQLGYDAKFTISHKLVFHEHKWLNAGLAVIKQNHKNIL